MTATPPLSVTQSIADATQSFQYLAISLPSAITSSHLPVIRLLLQYALIQPTPKPAQTSHIPLLYRCIQVLIRATLFHPIDSPPSPTSSSHFLHHLRAQILHHAPHLGRTYASLIHQHRAYHTAISFLQSIAPHPSANSFTLSATTPTKCPPIIAAAYLDILTFLPINPTHPHVTSFLIIVSEHLSAVLALSHLSLVQIQNCFRPISPLEARRPSFLLLILSNILRDAPSAASNPEWIDHDQQAENVWSVLIEAIQRCMTFNFHNLSFIHACLHSLISFIQCDHASTNHALNMLSMQLPSLLFQHYLFNPSLPSVSRHQRLLHTLLALDAITRAITDASQFSIFLKRIIDCREIVTDLNADRLIVVLLLRCMIRCQNQLIHVTLQTITSYIGTSNDRKMSFLPLASTAVMATDVGRKNACVKWIIDLYGTLPPNGNLLNTVDNGSSNVFVKAKL